MRIPFAVAVCATVAVAACGTASFEHRFEVVLNDPSSRLGAGPEVSIFDYKMGRSEEWARRTIGVATASKPYSGAVGDQAVQWGWDWHLPPDVEAGLAIPALEKNGYFVVNLAAPGAAQATTLAFVPYSSDYPEGLQVKPLAARYQADPADKGWRITLTVDIPPP